MTRPSIAIVGGGFTGAAIAYHLHRLAPDHCRILVFEPRESLGAGLAYGSTDPAHRINVPAAKMSLIPGDDSHFLRWLMAHGEPRDDPGARTDDGSLYPRRSLFGRYVAAYVMPLVTDGVIDHRRERVVGIERLGRRWALRTAGGASALADLVVIATSHPAPRAPAALDEVLAGHPRFIDDVNRPEALAAIREHDRVLVVGTGLTAADVIAALAARGHSGPIIAISRRGLRSRGHAAVPAAAFGSFTEPPSRSAAALVGRVRDSIAAAAALGLGWQAVIDAVRQQGREIWRTLGLAERRRLVRHLRPFWDVHRFRVAPPVERVIEAKLTNGSLTLFAAGLVGATVAGEDIQVTLRRRGRATAEAWRVDAVVVTTGPDHGGILASQPFLQALAEQGLVTLDPTGLGLACDETGRALGRDGRPLDSLLIGGPLARGTLGELMGLPQVTEHAAFIASAIARWSETWAAAGEPRPGARPAAPSDCHLVTDCPRPCR